jgi:hypothetical protein
MDRAQVRTQGRRVTGDELGGHDATAQRCTAVLHGDRRARGQYRASAKVGLLVTVPLCFFKDVRNFRSQRREVRNVDPDPVVLPLIAVDGSIVSLHEGLHLR